MLHHYTEFVDAETIGHSDEVCNGVIEEYRQIEVKEGPVSDNESGFTDDRHFGQQPSTHVKKIRFPAF